MGRRRRGYPAPGRGDLLPRAQASSREALYVTGQEGRDTCSPTGSFTNDHVGSLRDVVHGLEMRARLVREEVHT